MSHSRSSVMCHLLLALSDVHLQSTFNCSHYMKNLSVLTSPAIPPSSHSSGGGGESWLLAGDMCSGISSLLLRNTKVSSNREPLHGNLTNFPT